MQVLAKRLKERREALGLSQADLAERMKSPHASRAQLSHYESDRRTPSLGVLRDLCKALKCSADWLLGMHNAPPGC